MSYRADHKAYRVKTALTVLPVLMAKTAHRDLRGHKDLKVYLVKTARQDHKAQQDHKDHKDHKDRQVPMVWTVPCRSKT